MARRLRLLGTVTGCVLLGWAAVLPTALGAPYASEPQQGAQIFVDSGCMQCHGANGMGTSKGPSLRTVRQRMSDDQVHSQIKDGGKSMPPFGDALADAQIAQLVMFVRSKNAWKKPLPPPTPPAEVPSTTQPPLPPK